MKRPIWFAAILVAALTLAGCGAMPSASDVFAGAKAEEGQAPTYDQLPDDPSVGASPRAIVEGFIAAATSPADDYEVARKFLADPSRWKPGTGTTVDVDSKRHYDVSPDPSPSPAPSQASKGVKAPNEVTVSVTMSPRAIIDPTGVYSQIDDAPIKRDYVLEKRADGEWRIKTLPNGIVIEEALFSQVYAPYQVMFFDQTFTFLVPDLRWYPRAAAPNRITAALVAGPSDALRQSVSNAFPEGTVLREPSTTIDGSGQATVGFSDIPQPTPQMLSRMQLQLLQSLRSVSTIRTLQMMLGTTTLTSPEIAVPSTTVESRTLVIRDGKLGSISSSDFMPITDFGKAESVKPTAFVLRAGSDRLVVRAASGTVSALRRDGVTIPLDDRPSLINPTVDPWGYVWSVPSNVPADMRVLSEDATEVHMRQGLRGFSSITAMEVSRDGSRLAVLGLNNGQLMLGIVPIIRDGRGKPTSVGDFTEIATPTGQPVDIAWLDNLTVGALLRNGKDLSFRTQQIGGVGEAIDAPPAAFMLTGTASASSPRILSRDGVVYTRRGNGWQRMNDGVEVLGTQQVASGN